MTTTNHGLSLWPPEACLISELARELTQLAADELQATHVVLPTDRLSRWLYALLSESRTAFVPPRCYVLESFVSELAKSLSLDAGIPEPLAPAEQELLLTALLKEGIEAGRFRHLRLGHEHEVAQLFAELDDWQLEADAFARLSEVVAANVYLSEGGLDTLSERVAELASLYTSFHDRAMAVFGCETQSRAAARRYRELAAAVEAGAALPGRRLYLVGFTSAKGMQEPLLRALVRRPEVMVWLSEPPAQATAKNPLALLLAMLGSGGARRAVQAPLPAAAKTPRLAIHRTDTVLGEVAHALELAGEAIAAGLAPSAIALLVTNEAAYGKPLRALLRGAAFAANVALATPLAATEAGTWLAAVLGLAASDESLTRVLALATHPLTLAWWRDQTPASAGAADDERGGSAWETELKERIGRELLRSGVERGLAALAASPKVSRDVSDLLSSLAAALGPLVRDRRGGPLPLAAWTRWLAELCEAFLLGPDDGEAPGSGDKGLSAMAKDELRNLLAAFKRVGELLSPPLTQAEFLALAGEKLAQLVAHEVGDPLRGVQILSIAEARYVPFELAIVIGCVEGDFPRALPKDHLVDNYLKTKIGLPGWQLLEAIEDTTFHLLHARLPLMVLLHPETRGSDHVVRSRFIEAALARREAVAEHVGRDREILALLGAALPGDRSAKTPGGRDGPQGEVPEHLRAGLLAALSASKVEGLIRCPYRFLLESLGVETAELPREDDARREGDWLHDVLEAFFTGAVDGRKVAPELATDGDWAEFPAYATGRLNELTTALAPPHAKDSPLELHVRRRSWPAFVKHLTQLYTPETLALALQGWRERRLAHGEGDMLPLAVKGRTVKLRGAIDAVDRLDALHVITDYKRSGTPTRADVRRGLSPQLLVYAQAVTAMSGGELPLARAVVGYWSILKGRWIPLLAGSEALAAAKQRGLVGRSAGRREEDTLEGAVQHLAGLWDWRLGELSEAGAAFRPDASACGHCHYQGICRKNDPELGAKVLAATPLAARLGSKGQG